ncbi:hypothetical protein TGMAS_221265 [Toxoplasma gondii MAS]|uniref:Uncharacterized protein n=1 Tax=Toxoplasma gondii MAS TaxID=943118 RepID=A0A086QPD1_TOXGO|nr:hypothetical protein TGMAS_221265 [Toxoplasma gondii MAS]
MKGTGVTEMASEPHGQSENADIAAYSPLDTGLSLAPPTLSTIGSVGGGCPPQNEDRSTRRGNLLLLEPARGVQSTEKGGLGSCGQTPVDCSTHNDALPSESFVDHFTPSTMPTSNKVGQRHFSSVLTASRASAMALNNPIVLKNSRAHRTPAAFSVHCETMPDREPECCDADITCLETALRGECVACSPIQKDVKSAGRGVNSAVGDRRETEKNPMVDADGPPCPVIVRDSFSYWVIYKPPFWSCAAETEMKGYAESGAKGGTAPTLGSVIAYLQKHFPVTRSSAIYNNHINYGVLFPLETEWSGFLVVAKTFNAYTSLKKQLEVGKFHGTFQCVVKAAASELGQIARIPLLSADANSPSLLVTNREALGTMEAAPENMCVNISCSKKTKNGGASESSELRQEAGCEHPFSGTETWSHVSLDCIFILGGASGDLPKSGLHRFLTFDDPFVQAVLAQTGRNGPCRRVFFHGTALSFYDIDARLEHVEKPTQEPRCDTREPTEEPGLPLCTFECALPMELEESLSDMRETNNVATITPKKLEGSKGLQPSTGDMDTLQSNLTAHPYRKLSLAIVSLCAFTTGALLCRRLVISTGRWTAIQTALASFSSNLLHFPKVDMAGVLATKHALLDAARFLKEGGLALQLQQLRMFALRLLSGEHHVPDNSLPT